MVSYPHNEWYYKLNPSALGEDILHVLSFEGEESISRLFKYEFELLSKEADLDPVDILNKPATFTISRGPDADPIEIHGIISHFEQHGRSPDYVFYRAVLVPKFWRSTLTYQSVVYQELNIEELITKVMQDAGYANNTDFLFDLNDTYPVMEYVVQYKETDFDFINRRLEHFGIYYYFDHKDGTDKVIFIDSNEKIPAIEQEEEILYNANHAKLTSKEVISELSYQQKVVTGLVKLNDYNYRYPGNSLLVENQIDGEAPGVFYDYGDHYKDTGEGATLARIRNEEILCASKLFYGKSDSRLFQAGHSFEMDLHYREDWNSKYILTNVKSYGDQRTLFAYMAPEDGHAMTYENAFIAIPKDQIYRPPRITPIPRIHGIMTAKMESGNNDEYAYLDDQGRYKLKVPFDIGDKTDGSASRVVRMSSPYSGPDYGIHFPNHADTEMLWSCVDGDPDRILGLGTLPNPHNPTPSTSANKAQSVIRTAGQHELHFDDTTGSENIFLHSTKDWTINITNDKNQTVGNNETLSVGTNRTKSVGNDESVTIGNDHSEEVGNDQTLTVTNNREKTVGQNQSESIGVDKTINVGSNHTENIGNDMSQTVGMNKETTVGIENSLTVGVNYTVTVGAMMEVSVGGTKSETVGIDSSEEVGSTKSLDAGKNIEFTAGDDLTAQAGKKIILQSGDDFTVKSGKKGVIDVADQLTIKCGSATITMKKNGDITINGKKMNLKASGNMTLKGSKILEN